MSGEQLGEQEQFCLRQFVRPQLPDLRGLIKPASDDPQAVWTEPGAYGLGTLVEPRSHRFPRDRIPNARPPTSTRSEEPAAIAAELHRMDVAIVREGWKGQGPGGDVPNARRS